ncbi:50S ribosomal protein L29 [Nitratiruptor sp. YY09-18]|uniref:50S ribosomal protein L29 n=1 Tax=Nitratiruptor sp. YY09-18 TaxID=2724901 RepID=UPI001915B61A|nr:50S ribosomal protein L29 [Nitratiruptor sp. YY09-18]BCD67368.1 large subunit ribosomal protein L29 [Nitratiruptor sp. YY09-18]
MNYTELKEKSLQELEGLLKDKKLELFELRMKLKTMQLQDTSQIRKTRKDIARIKTAIAEKRRAG